MSDDTQQVENTITVRGSLSTVFCDAIHAAMGDGATQENKEEIASIVAMESAAQDVSIMNAIVSKISQGYSMVGSPTKPYPGVGKVLVDVIDAADPDEEQLMDSISILDDVEYDNVPAENFVPVIVLDSEMRPDVKGVVTGFESMCRKVGVKVHYVLRKVKA